MSSVCLKQFDCDLYQQGWWSLNGNTQYRVNTLCAVSVKLWKCIAIIYIYIYICVYVCACLCVCVCVCVCVRFGIICISKIVKLGIGLADSNATTSQAMRSHVIKSLLSNMDFIMDFATQFKAPLPLPLGSLSCDYPDKAGFGSINHVVYLMALLSYSIQQWRRSPDKMDLTDSQVTFKNRQQLFRMNNFETIILQMIWSWLPWHTHRFRNYNSFLL